MYNIEKLIAVIILLIILLLTINSFSNILSYINNNNVRFLMILFIIIIGHYDVKMAGLSGLLFLLLVNKANYIEGFNQSNSNKQRDRNVRMWLYLMLINPKSFDSKENNVVRNEIAKLKLDPNCKNFTDEYSKIMDDNLAVNILIFLVDTNMTELDIIRLYQSSNPNIRQLRRDLEIFLIENQQKIEEKQYLNNKRFEQMIKERNIKVRPSLIENYLIPFLENPINLKCLHHLIQVVVNNLKQKYIKENNSQKNVIEKTPEQKADDAKIKASEARSIADQKSAELNDAEYNAVKLKMYAEAKWVEAKASEAKKLAETKAAEAKAAEAKVNEEKSNQSKGLAEAESAKSSLAAKSLADEALRLKILALEVEEEAKVKANAYAAYDNKKKNESNAEPKKAEKELKAIFYEHCDYQGRSIELGQGSYDYKFISNDTNKFNDSISSIKVPKGLKVIAFENDLNNGRSITLLDNNPCLINDSFNDIISSIIVINIDEQKAEKDRIVEAERQKAEKNRIVEAERQKAEKNRIVEAERQKAEQERRVEAERQKAEQERRVEAERQNAERQQKAEKDLMIEAERQKAELNQKGKYGGKKV